MAVDRVANSAAVPGVAPHISGAISKAAESTGISFQYLLTTARIESSLNPQAQAATSSAKGLYQFIDQTWLATVKQDGASLGLGQYADAITRTASGRYEVADPAMRSEILKQRTDPAMSAMMAGALARTNAEYLTAVTGKVPTEGELYTAHFLGPDGAGRLINAVNSRGNANAAAMFPAAAAANRPIFYNRDGSARTVTEVYDRLTAKFDNTRLALVQNVDRPPAPIDQPGTGHVLGAQAPDSAPSAPSATRAVAAPVKVPDTAGMTQVLAAADNRPPPVPSRPLFAAMFSDGERGAVSRTVTSLWSDTEGAGSGATSLPAPGPVASADRPVRMHDLFTDSAARARGLFTGRG
ncbi:transglycosylase SLT domain-containing protein [Undibacter mobilis]|uniref:Lytic transglycosylase domain-containing protein n=1 Tax=Undibacter mobilis TaxID=2292256 RepID=A0A371BCN2_9BRAD|nr:transglycosylase SLT domain-containing protein [Undibacter mobilis]RDV05359.1 lytic transglycosylase domain-containing protein [Undibacter mobilis]